MQDYSKIKAEYLRGGVGIRKLAHKHGVSPSTLEKIASKEKWADLRKESSKKKDAILAESVGRNAAKREDNIITVADKLLKLISNRIDSDLAQSYPGQELRFLTMCVKDLAQIKGFQSKLDEREQMARIAKLEREAAGEAEQKEIRVVIGNEADSYAE